MPPVNGDAHLETRNVNMVTRGGQATIPIVAAVSAVTPVHYGEIPPRSPNCNPHTERFIRSAREECTDGVLLSNRGHAEKILHNYARVARATGLDRVAEVLVRAGGRD